MCRPRWCIFFTTEFFILINFHNVNSTAYLFICSCEKMAVVVYSLLVLLLWFLPGIMCPVL